MSEDKTGKTFERQVADLYRALGAWKVEHDKPMAGHQIDVYVEMVGPDRFTHRCGSQGLAIPGGH
jgi:isocitrate dehydrogenase kinase/phosphatase